MPAARVVGEGTKATKEVCLTFTGIPRRLVDVVKEIIEQRKKNGETGSQVKMASVYWDAVQLLMKAAEDGDNITVPAQTTGEDGQRVAFWIRSDYADDLNAFHASLGRGNRSNVLIAALELYAAQRTRRISRKKPGGGEQ